ncbi:MULTISPECIES: PepSY domain-containing protein [Paenibacillus]|uniref:PepSY domain-containing protein n=1 Tax=Paenibacillus TaxID=44249 RepID=UPI001F3D86AE|nr:MULTISPECIES: PepSY domain-containing protein [Paenibacillus]MCF2719802.1 PepSY domain-containing protein [Paenibacillus sp. UKAQ_18]MCP3781312.1 PepSY domain-containing protein [Paenibacillus sp. MZ03-122A]MDY7989302.1 PepSY domain-containing protein [Paenibacillus polymyxa]MDY8115961.1 PepSY domain-containing protein [Paenibacillus polymyxa]
MYGIGYNSGPVFRQRISLQQAQEIALRNVPGQVVHVGMDLENGIFIYEIFILTPQNKIFEVEVVAKTGRIIKIEEEDDFD